MSFGALVGGSDCGPSNPLAQLSKAYRADRGVQQDHFGRGASGSSGFRHHQPPSNPEEAALFFAQQQQQGQQQPFDLQSLHRNLPQQQHARPSTPAWAQAFQSDQQLGGPGGGASLMEIDALPQAEKENFMRAFNAGGGQGGAQEMGWSNDFVNQSRLANNGGNTPGGMERQRERERGILGRGGSSQSMMYGGSGGGVMMNGGMSGMGMMGRQQIYPGSGMMLENNYERGIAMSGRGAQETSSQKGQVDWETAFLAQESIHQSPAAADSLASHYHPEQILHTPTPLQDQRPSSPGTTSRARDELAATAGALLSTVQSVQRSKALQQEDESGQQTRTTEEKFANSTFLDLMRKLRDGEVAVEGDKVVEQIGAVSGNKGKGVDRGAWSGEFREEEGRTGANLGRGMGMGMGIERTEGERQEEGFSDMRDVWEEEDRVREGRERGQALRKVQFQGDGGATEEMMRLDGQDFDEGRGKTFEEMRMETSVPMASENWEEDFDASMIAGGHARNDVQTEPFVPSAQQMEWDKLQGDWDNFEATSTGLLSNNVNQQASTSTSTSNAYEQYQGPAPSSYSFSSNNPYLATRTHAMHSSPRSTYESILEKEAFVQMNPDNSLGWLALGIKQQENEREELAIQALNEALRLDPTMGEAYLALAVSYTNENERNLSYTAVDKWIESMGVPGGGIMEKNADGSRKEAGRYHTEISSYRSLFGPIPDRGLVERHEYLTGLLIRLARSRVEVEGGDVDAEVQIGLGVLFNASEEYDKAGDCFESALSVRPDDPLLFNRLGATLANSGKTELAIQYYLEALEIQPSYVRARFNLAVANMNLSHYSQAVEHLLTALAIQEADSALQAATPTPGEAPSRVTSQTLWDSLNTALLMLHRSDLANFASSRNLDAFRNEFPSSFE